MNGARAKIRAAFAILLATASGLSAGALSSDPEWSASVSGASAVVFYDEADALFG